MYLLVTCVLSEMTRPEPDPGVLDWVAQQVDSTLFISVITAGELLYGVYRLPDSHKKTRLNQWLNGLLHDYRERILPLDTGAVDHWARMAVAAAQAGKTLALADGYIAAIALQYDMAVVTRNVRDFEETGVRVVNPWMGGEGKL